MNKKPIVFSLFQDEHFSNALSQVLGYTLGKCNIHHFPDEETLVTIKTPVNNEHVILIASLDRPNNKLAPLLFAAKNLRDAGANKISLIAPYLAYMRQDNVFHKGEGITSKYFAELLSDYFDEITTIEPHLHRWDNLNQIFTIPTTLLHVTSNIADWIKANIKQPVLIGPDMESVQWVEQIAKLCAAPYLIAEKTRIGDNTVSSSIPKLELYLDHVPVLIDDIISTGMTMIEIIKHIQACSSQQIICIAVHAVFAHDAYQTLLKTGISELVTCNTIKHLSNKIDVSNVIIDAFAKS